MSRVRTRGEGEILDAGLQLLGDLDHFQISRPSRWRQASGEKLSRAKLLSPWGRNPTAAASLVLEDLSLITGGVVVDIVVVFSQAKIDLSFGTEAELSWREAHVAGEIFESSWSLDSGRLLGVTMHVGSLGGWSC